MPRFAKGSQEAKDYMAKIRGQKGKPKDPNAPAKKSKGKKKEDKGPEVEIGMVGTDTLVLPEYLATQNKGKLKLVNPITQERHIAKRKKQTVIKIVRKAVDGPVIIDGEDEKVPLKRFGKKDREKLQSALDKVKAEAGKNVEERPDILFEKPKTRGRPEILPKNIKMNKLKRILQKREKRKVAQAFDILKDGEPVVEPEPEPVKQKKIVKKNIQIDIGKKKEKIEEEESKEDIVEPVATATETKKGAKKKYESAEDARKAKIAKTVESNKRRQQLRRDIKEAKKEAKKDKLTKEEIDEIEKTMLEDYKKEEADRKKKLKEGSGIMQDVKKTFKKGSQEAKDYMAKLRSMKGKGICGCGKGCGKCGSGIYSNLMHPATSSIETSPDVAGEYANTIHPAISSIEKHPFKNKKMKVGMGIVKMKKGSQEAKDFMAKLRSMRKK
jgi:hypothetical protein